MLLVFDPQQTSWGIATEPFKDFELLREMHPCLVCIDEYGSKLPSGLWRVGLELFVLNASWCVRLEMSISWLLVDSAVGSPCMVLCE